jgi:hypothetical protein
MAYELEVTIPTSEKTQFGLASPVGSVAGYGEEPVGGVYSFTSTGHDITDRHIARLHPKIRKSVSSFIRECLSDNAIQKIVYINESVRSASEHDALKKVGKTITEYKESHHSTGTGFKIILPAASPDFEYLTTSLSDPTISAGNLTVWELIGAKAIANNLYWGGTDGWSYPHFEFRDCSIQPGALKYHTRSKKYTDADGWFELYCLPT